MTYTKERLKLISDIKALEKPVSELDYINLNSLTEEQLELFKKRLEKLQVPKKKDARHLLSMSDKEFSELLKDKK